MPKRKPIDDDTISLAVIDGEPEEEAAGGRRPAPAAGVAQPPAMVVRRARLEELHPDPANARLHDEENLDDIRNSLLEFGQVELLVVQKGTGKVIGGNGRLTVMREMGWTEVDIAEVDANDVRAAALAIALNRSAEKAKWDDVVLARTLKALQSENFDIGKVGFDDDELDAILERAAEALGGPLDERPEGHPADEPAPIDQVEALQAKWQVQPGDLWVIPASRAGQEHRILCGDSTKAGDVARVLDGEPFALLLTDPPYGVSYLRGQFNGCTGGGKVPRTIVGDDRKLEEQRAFVSAVLRTLQPFAAGPAPIYMFSASMVEGCFSMFGMLDAGAHVQSQLVWVKNNFVMGRADHHWKHELCWYGWFEGKNHAWYGGRDKATVLECKRLPATLHPNEKPVVLLEPMLANSSREGDVVLDAFSGSGATLVACETTGRQARVLEIDPKFVALALERATSLGLEPYRAEAGPGAAEEAPAGEG
jgi:DNA modification methylase